MNKILFILLFSVLSAVCSAGTIDPNTADNQYIEYGTKFLYIGQIIGSTAENEPYFASCVALNDTTIITAAHVLAQTKNQIVNINNKNINLDAIIIHNNYNSQIFGYNDIALASLNQPIGLEWYPSLYNKKNETGKICSLSGFGMTGTFYNGAIKSDKYKRAGSNIIDTIDRGMLVCTPSINYNKTELEFLIAPGDSGGGLFIGNELAGIHSCIMANGHKARSDYKTESGHTRISDHVDWINNTIKRLNQRENNEK